MKEICDWYRNYDDGRKCRKSAKWRADAYNLCNDCKVAFENSSWVGGKIKIAKL